MAASPPLIVWVPGVGRNGEYPAYEQFHASGGEVETEHNRSVANIVLVARSIYHDVLRNETFVMGWGLKQIVEGSCIL